MEVKAFSPEKKELEKERSLLAEESDAEPRKLRARQVKETTTEVKCEKKEIAEPKKAQRSRQKFQAALKQQHKKSHHFCGNQYFLSLF